jgi:SHS2 domain-containing protein
MMLGAYSGYREIEHTADWELEIWAPNMPSLIEQAARGMYALSKTRLAESPRLSRQFEISVLDHETLVVDFLSELLFFEEHEGIAFDSYIIEILGSSCRVQLSGAPILEIAKEIKAVTYHGIHVRETARGLEVNIVFDV